MVFPSLALLAISRTYSKGSVPSVLRFIFSCGLNSFFSSVVLFVSFTL